MQEDKYIFVEVTKIFMMTPTQGKRLLTIARAINAVVVFSSTDTDKTELSWTGDDYLTEQNEHDFAGAACDVPDPEGLLQIKLVSSASHRLS